MQVGFEVDGFFGEDAPAADDCSVVEGGWERGERGEVADKLLGTFCILSHLNIQPLSSHNSFSFCLITPRSSTKIAYLSLAVPAAKSWTSPRRQSWKCTISTKGQSANAAL